MAIVGDANESLWSQKYRPRTIADTILPAETKARLQSFVDKGDIPNLMLSGGPGVGKTTAAMAMMNELGCDYIFINGSLDGGIDTLRHKVSNFASTVSFEGGRKVTLLDEADALTSATQSALRAFIEDMSSNCGFILTCNFKNRLIQPLHSRFSQVSFDISKEERPRLAAQFFKRVATILQQEGIEFDKKVVALIVEKHFPDFRRTLNELQFYASTGKIDEGILNNTSDQSVAKLFEILKAKNFAEMRKWCADNSDIPSSEIFRKIYEHGVTFIKPDSLPEFIVQLGEYQFKHAFVADPEINMAAMLTVMMVETEFK